MLRESCRRHLHQQHCVCVEERHHHTPHCLERWWCCLSMAVSSFSDNYQKWIKRHWEITQDYMTRQYDSKVLAPSLDTCHEWDTTYDPCSHEERLPHEATCHIMSPKCLWAGRGIQMPSKEIFTLVKAKNLSFMPWCWCVWGSFPGVQHLSSLLPN